jgi:hypothetical protein
MRDEQLARATAGGGGGEAEVSSGSTASAAGAASDDVASLKCDFTKYTDVPLYRTITHAGANTRMRWHRFLSKSMTVTLQNNTNKQTPTLLGVACKTHAVVERSRDVDDADANDDNVDDDERGAQQLLWFDGCRHLVVLYLWPCCFDDPTTRFTSAIDGRFNTIVSD